MVTRGNIQGEADLFRDYAEFLEEAAKLKARFEHLRLQVPPSLLRLAGAEEEDGDTTPRIQIPRMQPPQGTMLPPEYTDSWVWVEAKDKAVHVKSLVRAILRREEHPVPISKLIEQIRAIREDVNDGSVANIGTSLQAGGEITRGEEGWSLVYMDSCPILSDGYLWGLPKIFGKSEYAWFRREAIKHLLSKVPQDGLMVMQIANYLREFTWLPEPKDRDLVKGDMEALDEAGLVKMTGASKKWVLRTRSRGPKGGMS